MIFNVYPASGFLSQFVHFYWIMEIDEIVTPTDPNRVVPNGSVNLFFHYGDVLKYRTQDSSETMQFRSQISGQTTEYFDVYHTGKSSFLSVVFRPSGASLFFDIPIDIIINQHIDISSIDSRNSAFICEQLYHAPSSHQKIAVIEEYLIRNFREKKLYNHQRISSAIKEAISCGGNIAIDALASTACLSHKQFDRVFSDLVGLHPKQFVKITRLQHVFELLNRSKEANLLDIAFLAGYYDQAHFSKEFKLLTGFTPKQCLKECIPTSDLYLEI